ncbi:MAG: HNH/endonuclease VII fold putative polymorphic toxin [Reyranella sp.]|nr:HNH/endonuclease VII fold putative polymorphic toxin [Reyranella sp.]
MKFAITWVASALVPLLKVKGKGVQGCAAADATESARPISAATNVLIISDLIEIGRAAGENRLISASSPASSSYSFDSPGRRKSRTAGGSTTIFVTDADNREVLEYDGSNGQVLRWYAYGLGPNDVLGQMNIPANTRTTPIPDLLGSIVGSMDAGTGTLAKFAYQPYGITASAPAQFGYTGQRIDPETSGLYYYRARHYSPVLGRFLQPDPIGYAGGVNLYGYVGNDPLNLIDPSGFSALQAIQRAAFQTTIQASIQQQAVQQAVANAVANATQSYGTGANIVLAADKSKDDNAAEIIRRRLNPQARPQHIERVEPVQILQAPPIGLRPRNFTPEGAGRSGAFNAAKQSSGIPTSQQPSAILPNVDRTGRLQPGKVYRFEVPAAGGGTRTVDIRDDASGHFYGPSDPQNRGPHFNDPGGNHFDY